MNPSVNAVLGVLFLALGMLATGLMYQYWGYPYDKEKRKSQAPRWKMNIHRGVGVAYVIVYILLMIQMVPRIWEYQVELPARTVAHILLGLTIGFILLLKLSILRFWRHFEEWMPALGTALLLCTFLLLGVSLPFVYKERALVASAPGGSAFSTENVARVAILLPGAGFPDDADLAHIATAEALMEGRETLLEKCVYCHDLKTVIEKPRTPEAWLKTVLRMAEKPTLGDAIEPLEQYRVAAYLVAITPDLKRSAKEKRTTDMAGEKTLEALTSAESVPTVGAASSPASAPSPTVDAAEAKKTYEKECSLCHPLSDIDAAPPGTAGEVEEVLTRMVKNGFSADAVELELVRWHLLETFVAE